MRRILLTCLVTAVFGVFAQSALAAGGSYTFRGGTAKEQATVRNALQASSFNFGLIPRTIVVHIGVFGGSYSTAGDVYVDGELLDSGRYAWGVVQHEFGHQVDFFLLDDAKRAVLQQQLGGKDWCYETPGLQHADHGCERFASELAWAFWQSPDNSMQGPEAAGMPAAAFRTLLAQLLGEPATASPTTTDTKAFAPAAASKPRRKTKR
jgi:hypothetical protein